MTYNKNVKKYIKQCKYLFASYGKSEKEYIRKLIDNIDDGSHDMTYDSLLTSLNNKEVEKLEMETGSYTVKAIMKGEGSEEERTETVVVPSIQAFMEQSKYGKCWESLCL